MPRERRVLLTVLLLVLLGVAAFVLSDVIATVLLAGATGYVLLPVHRWFLRRGLAPYWSAIGSSLVAIGLSVLSFLPFAYIIFVQREEIAGVLRSLDGELTLFEVAGQPVVFDLGTLQATLIPSLSSLAVFLGRRATTLLAKFVVFAFVVFALLYYHDKLRGLVYGPVPGEYHDVVERVNARVRDVLFGHFVLAFLGASLTYLFGLGVFGVLGYQFPAALALAAAIFWILPFVNVVVFVLGLSASQALTGELQAALLIGFLGAGLLVAVPGILVMWVRDRIGDPEGLSTPVYFVGFVGGTLTLGPVGIVLGPVVLAVLLSLRDLLADGAEPLSE